MNKRIIYQNDNGSVAVLIPADCGLTLEQIAAKDVPPKQVFVETGTAVLTQEQYDEDPNYWSEFTVGDTYSEGYWETKPRPYKIVDVSEIPTDRTQRNAWVVDETDLTDGAN